MVVSYYPQVSSTRDLPHPIGYTFIKAAMAQEDIMAEAQQIVADQLGQVEKKTVDIERTKERRDRYREMSR